MKNKITFKYEKKVSNTLAYKLPMIITMALTLFCLLIVTLYIIGNYQNFLDESQNLLLSVLSYTSIFNMLLSIVLLSETIIKIVTEKYKFKNIVNMVMLTFFIILSFIFLIVSNVVNFISMGIN